MIYASMGPRQKCLGNKQTAFRYFPPYGLLQWGRDKNVSEITHAHFRQTPQYTLQWGRDKNVSEIEIAYVDCTDVQNASMGPRQKCLGNGITLSMISRAGLLQWGRDKNVSEIAQPRDWIR